MSRHELDHDFTGDLYEYPSPAFEVTTVDGQPYPPFDPDDPWTIQAPEGMDE